MWDMGGFQISKSLCSEESQEIIHLYCQILVPKPGGCHSGGEGQVKACFSQHFGLPWIDHVKYDPFNYTQFWSVPTLHRLYLDPREKFSWPITTLLLPALTLLWPLNFLSITYPGILTVLKWTFHTVNLTVMLYKRSFVNILRTLRDIGACHSHKMIIWIYFF